MSFVSPYTTAEARNVCAPDAKWAYPVTYECSLACTPLAWSFDVGVFNYRMYTTRENCPTGYILSRYFTGGGADVSPLGCLPTRIDGVWQGQTVVNLPLTAQVDIQPPIPQDQYLGLTLRQTLTMAVDNVNPILHCTLQLERLKLGSEFDPPQAANQWVNCCTYNFSMRKDAVTKTLDRNEQQVFETFGNDPLNPTFVTLPSCSSEDCPFDFQAIDAWLSLYPKKFGCDGNSETGQKVECSMNAGWRTFGCFQGYIEPTTAGAFYPKFLQFGINNRLIFSCAGAGCVYGEVQNDPFGILPPIKTAQPIGDCISLLTIGCNGELDQVSKQQIQVARTYFPPDQQTTPQPAYEIVIKSVNKRSPCVAIREVTTQNQWFVVQATGLTPESTFYATSGHWVVRIPFTECLGQPIVTLYGLAFPAVIQATTCVINVDPPNIFDPDYDKKKGLLVDPDSLNVLGYNNLSNANLIVTEPEIFAGTREEPLPENIPYMDAFTSNVPTEEEKQRVILSRQTDNPITAASPHEVRKLADPSIMKKYKNKCKYRSVEPIKKDNTCGCAGGGSNIYACEIFGECKVITTKMEETYKTCVSCDRYELPVVEAK